MDFRRKLEEQLSREVYIRRNAEELSKATQAILFIDIGGVEFTIHLGGHCNMANSEQITTKAGKNDFRFYSQRENAD